MSKNTRTHVTGRNSSPVLNSTPPLPLLTQKWPEGFQLLHMQRYQGGGGKEENGSYLNLGPLRQHGQGDI